MPLYKNSHLRFKANISIDKASFSNYGTIILQTPQPKRVTVVKFFGKINKAPCYFFTVGKRQR